MIIKKGNFKQMNREECKECVFKEATVYFGMHTVYINKSQLGFH